MAASLPQTSVFPRKGILLCNTWCVVHAAYLALMSYLQFQNLVRARTRDPTGNDVYNYFIGTFNARGSMGSFMGYDRTLQYTVDAPFASLGVNV